ncbi:hypothetical protein TPA4_36 [Tsukamurella phage TPA4]|uniref:hypothetical protein n=1 Tax=Tsukamurella phage TPA4 TaxID=1647476 RepID=UPI0007B63E98|nr:hypothetical protein BH784_gp36 [Tsukamurella phage TPA4]AKJ72201.1 hypothetical protein TPA4_36 [Tsukamurella phage TPA4]
MDRIADLLHDAYTRSLGGVRNDVGDARIVRAIRAAAPTLYPSGMTGADRKSSPSTGSRRNEHRRFPQQIVPQRTPAEHGRPCGGQGFESP